MLKTLILAPLHVAVKPFPNAERRLEAWKGEVKHTLKLKYFLLDLLHAKRFMFWSKDDSSYAKLSAELVFQYHKLEKGLCIPGSKRFFGRDPVIATCLLVDRWRQAEFPIHDPVYLGALETLRAYRRRLEKTPPPEDQAQTIERLLSRALADAPEVASLSTPMPHRQSVEAMEAFDRLCHERRSVRSYSSEAVPIELLKSAINIAQLSPSACNRQPWRVHVYRNPQRIKAMLALQNGNSGFGHQISTLLVICADSRFFFDASERNEPYLDSGLFVMSLILALQARGLASCCLNWCVSPDTDRQGHLRGSIPEHEKIVTYLAVGYAHHDAVVPRSPRRSTDSVTIVHAE